MTDRTSRVALRLAYVAVIALATLTPFQPDFALAAVGQRFLHAFHLGYSARDAIDAVRNVILFTGWGALWVATSPPTGLPRILREPTLAGCALSIGAETIQLFLPERNASILDVITNTAGSWLGAAVIVFAVLLAKALRDRKSYVGLPMLVFAGAYGAAVCIDGLFPLLRVDALPGAYGGPFSRLRIAMAAFSWASLGTIPVGDVLEFFPLGAFIVAALVELGRTHRDAARRTILLGIAGSVIVELGHGPLGLPIQVGAVVAHGAGIALGAVVCARWLPAWSRQLRGAARPALLLFLYAALMAFWEWRPFVIEADMSVIASQLSLSRLIPLEAQSWRVDLFSVADVAAPFFLYFPLGALLAVWPIRNRGLFSGCLPALWIALATELGQIFISGRYFDGTDLLVQWAGAGIGWAVIRRAGFPQYGPVVSAGGGTPSQPMTAGR
jgi:VanZ family protein